MICCNLRWLVITVASMCDVCRYTQIKTLLMMILAWHTALAETKATVSVEAIYCISLIVTKKIVLFIMQALCQITPTGKLTDPYDEN